MFTIENKVQNLCAIRFMEMAMEEITTALADGLQSNKNSILLAEDNRLQSSLDDGTEIVVHGFVYDEKKADVLCYYHLLDTPDYENSCSVTETSLDLIEVLQAINDTFDNDPDSM